MGNYSVLIVDDDTIARSHLKSLVEWKELGFEVKAEAENGKEAMEMIKTMEPDVIITDMNMPVMDGVTLIRWIHTRYPEIVVIAISGYDDFDYVRSSLQGGAIDYILKHQLSSQLLEKTMAAAKKHLESLETTRIQKEDHAMLMFKLKKEKQREALASMILTQTDDALEYSKIAKELDFEYNLINNMMIVVDLDKMPNRDGNEENIRIRKIGQVFEDVIQSVTSQQKAIYHLMMGEGRSVILISNGSPYSLLKVYNDVYTLVQRIQSSLKRYLNMTACYAVSSVIPKASQLYDTYISLCAYYEQRFIKGNDQIFMANEMEISNRPMITLGYEEEKSLISNIRGFEEMVVLDKVEAIFERLLEQRADRSSTMIIARDLLRIILSILKENRIPYERVFGEINSPYQYMERYEIFMELKQWIEVIIKQLFVVLEENRKKATYSELIQKAMEYIHAHYHEDISLFEVSEAVGVSAAHLSRLFKDECGTNYIKYLNELRVEKAKILLNEGRPFKDVAEQTGFNHYNYFFKVFKDYTQMTPQEFVVHIKKVE